MTGGRKIRAVLRYDGTDFFGFQRQTAQATIQGALEGVLGALFKRRVTVDCAGRTDTGVHASGQVVTFMAPAEFPVERLATAANSLLPRTVSLHRPGRVDDTFSARFDARSRHYLYLLLNRRDRCALRARFTGHSYHLLDIERMNRAARDLCGTFDFRSFCGQMPAAGGTVRTLFDLEVRRCEELLRFDLIGNGFLHRMARIVVGTLIEIGSGRRRPDDFPRILAARDRRAAGSTVAASGLYLVGVRYDDFDSFALPPLLE